MTLRNQLQCLIDFGPTLPYEELGTAYTKEKMSLWVHTEKHVFETITLRGPQLPKARMEGRVYYLNDEEIIELDIRRQKGVLCHRKFIPILTDDRNKWGELTEAKAWVYIGNREHWKPIIDFEQENSRAGKYVINPKFKLAGRIPDWDKMLHNRFNAMGVELEPQPVYDPSEAIRLNCQLNNEKQSIRIQLNIREQELKARKQEVRDKAQRLLSRTIQFMKE